MTDPNDTDMLTELLATNDLSDDQEAAFRQMLSSLESNKISGLTKKQHDWVKSVHIRRGLSADESENLCSSGQVKVTEKDRADLKGFLGNLGPKPLKPPGRK